MTQGTVVVCQDSQDHSPPWHLKAKNWTLVAHSQKGGLHYSTGSCSCVSCPDFSIGMAKVMNCAHTLAHLLGKSWELFVVSARTGGKLRSFRQASGVACWLNCMSCYIWCTAFRKSWHLKSCVWGWWFWNIFSKMKVNLMKPEKESKDAYKPWSTGSNKNSSY